MIRQKINLIKKEKTLITGILLLLAGAAISTVFSSDIRVSAGILKGWFFDPLLFFIIFVSVIKNSSQMEKALKIFSFSGFAVAVIGLFYWFGYLPDGVSYDGRLHAFYSSPNYLAMYLAVPFIVEVWFYFKNYLPLGNSDIVMVRQAHHDKKADVCHPELVEGQSGLLPGSGNTFRSEKYFWLIVVLITASSIYLTYSYAAWFAIFFAVILLSCFTAGVEKKISFQWKLIFLSIFLVLAVLFFSQSGTSKFENLKNLAYRSSANSRLMIWRSALAIGRDHPIFGVGPGSFQKYYLDYQTKFAEPYLEWAVPQPHNIFLAFWLETGLLGLTGFVVIIFWFFRAGILILKKRRLNGAYDIAIILLFAMVYILLHGFIDTTYWKNDLALIFWLMLGLMLVNKKSLEN